MTHIPTQHEVETFSGRYVDTKRPRAESICLEDIAHALANTCRYGGHCSRFYSVAEHAVLVSKRLEQKVRPRDLILAGLHHDDAEAYLGDIPRPMKSLLGQAYVRLTLKMDLAVGAALGLDPMLFHDPHVKDADNWALFVEARHLLPSKGINWSGSSLEHWGIGRSHRVVTPPYWTEGLPPAEAEGLFLSRHHELVLGG